MICVFQPNRVRKYLALLKDLSQSCESIYQPSILYYMRTVGATAPEVLCEYREFVEDLGRDASLRDSCQALLDLMDQRRCGIYRNTLQKSLKHIALNHMLIFSQTF